MSVLWRKQILPFTTVLHRGRRLALTPAYLHVIAASFSAGAVDQVPFLVEDSRGQMSGDPSLCRGWVCRLEEVDDGMDAIVAVDGEGDALLAADPQLAAAPRLAEPFRVASGIEFPVALLSLHTTSRPLLTGLRPWRREEP